MRGEAEEGWGVGGGGHAVARRVCAVCASVKLVDSLQSAINVSVNSRHTGFPDDRNSM